VGYLKKIVEDFGWLPNFMTILLISQHKKYAKFVYCLLPPHSTFPGLTVS
jgi:hypothetical protein